MATAHTTPAEAVLAQVEVKRIDRNPDNPRIHFRQGEQEQLLDSINRYNIQVPIAVYQEGRRYVLIDGERRWRCALKLGMKTIPAMVQAKPSALEKLLLMFNIHALREQWDLLTQALKLRPIETMIEAQDGRAPTERELAARTGLTRATIRRCKLLLAMPEDYLTMILTELEKPKAKQKFTEDFFIEMERSLRTVQTNMPELIQGEQEKDSIRRVLIDKYKREIIPSRIHFRKLSKIARASRVAADPRKAKKVLRDLFKRNTYSIERAYDDSVSEAYTERDVVTRIESLIQRLRELDPTEIDEDVRDHLKALIREAEQLLERDA
jgi:ParB family transcriptional regulator, chromosome partitioning protein